MDEALLERVHTLACEALAMTREELGLDDKLVDLGVDSLDWAELVLNLEHAFGISISEEHARQLHTLREVAALVASGGVLPAPVEAAAQSPSAPQPPTAAARLEVSSPRASRTDDDDSRIVITGLGVVSPLGCDPAEMFEALLQGRSGITKYQGELETDAKVTIAAHARGFDAESVFGARGKRRFGRFALMAVAAARQAVTACALREAGYASERIGVMLGVGLGGLEVLDHESKMLHTRGGHHVSAHAIIGLIPNMAAGLVSQEIGARGPSFTTASACASGGHAIGQALQALRAGTVDAVVTGGVEACLTPLALACFSQIGALSRRNDDPARASRPFDKDRDGFVLGEGAGVLVLERLGAARRRGAHIHAELAGYGASADAYHPVEPDPEGQGASLAMAAALADAGERYDEVRYVNAHGTSTPYNDRVETRAIKRVFAEHAPRLWVSSTKSMTGHMLGAAGAVEAIITALTIEHGRVPPTINLEAPDIECDLDYVPNVAREGRVRVAISNSFAFGGQNASLVLHAIA